MTTPVGNRLHCLGTCIRPRSHWRAVTLAAVVLGGAIGVEAAPLPVADAACRSERTIDALLGEYEVVSAERYRGGLLSAAEAHAAIGKRVLISKDRFILRGRAIAKPIYRISCHRLPDQEGEVPVKRWSNFYGYGMQREAVEVLEVHDFRQPDSAAEIELEFVGGDDAIELLELYDGWLFRMTR